MNILYNKQTRVLNIQVPAEIDQYIAEKIRNKVDFEIEKYMPKKVLLDFENVNFMDSAGIGLIIGRYKTSKMVGSTFKICNVSPQIKKVLEMAGILKIIPIEDK